MPEAATSVATWRTVDVRDGSWSHSSRRHHSGFNGCCTVMWKANGKNYHISTFRGQSVYKDSAWKRLRNCRKTILLTYYLLFNPQDEGDMFLRNVSRLSTDYTALQLMRHYSSTLNLSLYLDMCQQTDLPKWGNQANTDSRAKNSVALVRKRSIPTERPSHVGEVDANFCG
jgi:hypothetical protein